ncbi:MAG: hypothetical protein GTN84_22250 [Hydrogenophaga sp.]|uniref:hypothetical protein n=1 Tax=Hydrogenophaga sp. TaxID=1904254 RepID=UPI0016937FFA|nr:hypothetical protein [Hydrogenophaga sp.]NIM43967.1 hypothetical protein [Hydrogenophaga sp.]NIN29031.1 hypothetical protein [Hydrogenophaga sp.]NIN33508.1 hypothetical protein [Hydrogenophaga sp.]NIN58167.1 hypothetical protein [Hydrogenophaga sp.]NIO54465.1 hypothetical protein [Hydrogenophaga sp.]
MSLTTLSGTVSGIRHSSETSGHIGKNGGNVHTKQVIAFRVDGQPAEIKLMNMPDVQDGERVTLAGRMKNGSFRALAMRNDQTRAIYGMPTTMAYVFGALLVLVGLPLLLVLVGVLFIGAGAWTLYEAWLHTQAANLLRA